MEGIHEEEDDDRDPTPDNGDCPPHKVDLPIILLLIFSAPGCFQNGDGDILTSHA